MPLLPIGIACLRSRCCFPGTLRELAILRKFRYERQPLTRKSDSKLTCPWKPALGLSPDPPPPVRRHPCIIKLLDAEATTNTLATGREQVDVHMVLGKLRVDAVDSELISA